MRRHASGRESTRQLVLCSYDWGGGKPATELDPIQRLGWHLALPTTAKEKCPSKDPHDRPKGYTTPGTTFPITSESCKIMFKNPNDITYLTPTRSTETDGEDGQKPGVRLAQPGQNTHHKTANDHEECDDEERDLPLRDRDIPEEAPVATVRLEEGESETCHS